MCDHYSETKPKGLQFIVTLGRHLSTECTRKAMFWNTKANPPTDLRICVPWVKRRNASLLTGGLLLLMCKQEGVDIPQPF